MIGKTCHAYFCPQGTAPEKAAEGLVPFLEGLTESGLTPIKVYMALAMETASEPAAFVEKVAASLEGVLHGRVPALTAVVQPPFDNSPLTAEIWCAPQQENCRFFKFGNLPQVLIEQDGLRELWTSGFFSENFDSAFESIAELLESEGFSFDDIFRQWNYVGHILEEKEVNGKKIQNYQHFNDIRAVYYQRKQDRGQYPAATGIGMEHPGICIDLVAVKAAPESRIQNLPLRSPVQKNAYQYNDRYLVGESVVLPNKNAPLFERGRCLIAENNKTAIISGTASIRGEATIDENDICKQTENTLQFTRDLLKDYPKARCLRARLYVKCGQNAGKAVRLFKAAFPENCVCTVVFADVCRNNLLVEIESDWQL